jgi:predicted acetyltransferase
VAFEIRPCRPEEHGDALRPIRHYFGGSVLPEEALARWRRLQPPERMHAAFDGSSVVGGAGVFPLRLTVPGGQLETAGVTVVAVLPTHRRRGVLTGLMRAQLDDVHERGEPLATLWASDERIYGRFGYGLASQCGSIDVPRDHAELARAADPVGRIRLVPLEEALEAFPPVYDRVAAQTPGFLSRSTEWWELRRLLDVPERREGGGEHVRALLEIDGEPMGYALYRIHPQGFEDGVSLAFATVIEAVGATDAATRELWGFLLGIDWVASVKASLLPVDHPLFLLLAEPRRMRFRVGDALWVRLVDVGTALSSRSYAGDGAVVFDVTDAFCPWNEGRWRLEGGTAERARGRPDLRCDVSCLGSVLLGGFSFSRLARAGLVEEARPGAIARADALFRTDGAPWCPEVF